MGLGLRVCVRQQEGCFLDHCLQGHLTVHGPGVAIPGMLAPQSARMALPRTCLLLSGQDSA